MDRIEEITIEIIAMMDRPVLPLRSWSRAASSNRYESMRQLPFVRWLGGGGSDAERKAGQTLLDKMIAMQMIEGRRHKTKTSLVRLTTQAEAATRKKCGLPSLAMSLRAMRRLSEFSDREPKTMDRLWVAEVLLNDGKGWDGTSDHEDHLVWIGDALIPAMHAGFVQSGSSIQGHGYFALTTSGWNEVDRLRDSRLKEFRVEEVGKIKGDPDSLEFYLDARLKEKVRLAIAPHDSMELGGIPLPVSMVGVRIVHDSPASFDDDDLEPEAGRKLAEELILKG